MFSLKNYFQVDILDSASNDARQKFWNTIIAWSGENPVLG